MADASANDDGLHLNPTKETHEEEQIEEWGKSEGNWSGTGKHISDWSDHETLGVPVRELGSGAFGKVEVIAYKGVTLARKQ